MINGFPGLKTRVSRDIKLLAGIRPGISTILISSVAQEIGRLMQNCCADSQRFSTTTTFETRLTCPLNLIVSSLSSVYRENVFARYITLINYDIETS